MFNFPWEPSLGWDLKNYPIKFKSNMEGSREEALLRRISELEKEVQSLEDQLRFLKAKDLELKPKTYSFWHESDNLPKNTNDSKYPALYLFNQQMDYEDDKGY